MKNAFREGLDGKFGKIIIIGSDCPGISAEIIEDGFNRLDLDDVVIGPSVDRGYYLIGSGQFIPRLFQNIPWSTENVYPETVSVLEKMDLRYGKLPVLNDIDTEEDLRRSEFG